MGVNFISIVNRMDIKKEWEYDYATFIREFRNMNYYFIQEQVKRKIAQVIDNYNDDNETEFIYNLQKYYENHMEEARQIKENMNALATPSFIFFLTVYMTFSGNDSEFQTLKYIVVIGIAIYMASLVTYDIFNSAYKIKYYELHYRIAEQFLKDMEK